MKLFLTSAGIAPAITGDFLKLLGKEPKDSRLIFVPTASDCEEDKWYVEKDKKRLAELGFKIGEINLQVENPVSLDKEFSGADVVYVEGGNTFYLLDWVRRSGFGVALKSFLNRGGLYVGVSAGSMIAGLNIETAGWKHADNNFIGLTDLTGMDLVNFAITPHFDQTVAAAVREAAAKTSYPTIALTDSQAILVDGETIKIVGPGERIIFNNPKIY